jgi:hypothetical protein
MSTKEADRLTLMLTARIPLEGVIAFQAYENTVLPLLSAFGGRLERRLRNFDGSIEVHIVSFPSEAEFQRYRADPRRIEQGRLLEESSAKLELTVMTDVS